MERVQKERKVGRCPGGGWLRLGLVAVLLLSAASWMPARAYTSDVTSIPEKAPDRWRIDIGGYRPSTFTEASLASTDVGLGAVVNFEDLFNMPSTQNVFRATAIWRMAKRQYLDFGYVALNRRGENTLDQDLTWGDKVIKANSDVSTQFRTQFPYAAWRYDFLQLDKVRISGSAGISYLGIKTSVAATGDIRDTSDPNTTVSGTLDRDFSINFPVPQLGLQLDWALTRTLALRMYIRTLYIDYQSTFKGGISERAIRLYWYMSKHFGLAGGLEQQSIDIKQFVSGDAKMRLRYEMSGLAGYLTFAF
jgi:hypothetical protein